MKKRVMFVSIVAIIILISFSVLAIWNNIKNEKEARENAILYQERYDKLMSNIKNTKKIVIGSLAAHYENIDEIKASEQIESHRETFIVIKTIDSKEEIKEYINIFLHIKLGEPKKEYVIPAVIPNYLIRLLDDSGDIIEDFTCDYFSYLTEAPLELDSKYLNELKELIER